MAVEVRLSEAARSDLIGIGTYIAQRERSLPYRII